MIKRWGSWELSEIIEAFLGAIEVVADNPASILIVLGFLATLIGWAFEEVGFLVLGGVMMTIGIVAHFFWLSR